MVATAVLVVMATACTSVDQADELSSDARAAVEAARAFEHPDRYGFELDPIGFGLPQCLAGIEPIRGVIDGDRVAAQPAERPGSLRLIGGELLAREELFSRPLPGQATGTGASWVRFDPTSVARERLDEVLGPMLASYIAEGAPPPDPNATFLAALDAASRLQELPSASGQTQVRVELDEAVYREANGLAESDDDAVPSVSAVIADTGRVIELEVRLPPSGGDHPGDGDGYRVRVIPTDAHDSSAVRLVESPRDGLVRVMDSEALELLERAEVECGVGISMVAP